MTAIQVSKLSKTFGKYNKALNNVSVTLSKGEMVALIGESGSGKSTLIRQIAGLVPGDTGSISVFGSFVQSNGRISKNARKHRRDIGVVFQQFNLVNRLSVLTNVLMGVLGRVPAWRTTFGFFTKTEKQLAMSALSRVGMVEHAAKRSSNLSGGQQQRAAIARTIVQGAKLILADEPIASLDPASSRKVMDNLARVNKDDAVTVLVSLHQVDYALEYCPRTIAMRRGEIVFDGPSNKLTPQFLRELYGADSIETIAQKKHEKPAQKKNAMGTIGDNNAEAALAYGTS